MFRSLEIVF